MKEDLLGNHLYQTRWIDMHKWWARAMFYNPNLLNYLTFEQLSYHCFVNTMWHVNIYEPLVFVWIHNLESSKIMFVVGQLWGMWLPWCQPKVFWMPYRSCSNTLPVSSFRRSAQYWKDHSFLNHFINYVYHDPYVCSVITICVYWWQGLNMNDEVHCSETNAYHFIWFKKLWAAQLFCSW